ncbi:hypothetical protein EYF80_061616 [Liparis tanakae]|uniref:Ig-like domain-containing protein n=1 Tax=Liparis tanakae TaxID=230148 RepID=A0A4Z2EHF2_9TELE|nr:hypothetical protein EYF80_061616 [Liparis tanakae]
MKLLLSSLLLASLCALSSWSVSSPGGRTVTQSRDVSVEEGGAVDITCCWTLESDRFRVHWMKNQTVIKNEIIYLKNHSHGSPLNETTGCSDLTFTNVTPEDSGRYICKVTEEIPSLSTVEGNGTVITVRTRNHTARGPTSSLLQSPGIIALAVGAPLLLVAFVCFYSRRRRQARAASVIYEVPHIDSEEVEMDKHSTSSSRGSSEWVSATPSRLYGE